MLWIIVVGLVAGIVARLLPSAPNKPTGASWRRRSPTLSESTPG